MIVIFSLNTIGISEIKFDKEYQYIIHSEQIRTRNIDGLDDLIPDFETLLQNGSLTRNGHLYLYYAIYQSWDGSTWINSSQYTYTYDGDGNMISRYGESWDGSAWVNSSQGTYAYDGDGNQLSFLHQTWDGSVWVSVNQYTHTYDGDGNRISSFGEYWDGSAWGNFYLYTYTYDGNGNRLSELEQSWDGNIWVNSSQYSNTYDGNENLLTHVTQTWDGSVWVSSRQYTFTYDGDGMGLSWLYQTWDGNAWLNDWVRFYTYATLTIKNNTTPYSFVLNQNYPNPFNPITSISYQITEAGKVNISVFNISGQLVETLVNEHRTEGSNSTLWNANNVSSGLYFYKLTAGNKTVTKKMLLIK